MEGEGEEEEDDDGLSLPLPYTLWYFSKKGSRLPEEDELMGMAGLPLAEPMPALLPTSESAERAEVDLGSDEVVATFEPVSLCRPSTSYPKLWLTGYEVGELSLLVRCESW